jgi:lambda family phage portal protein
VALAGLEPGTLQILEPGEDIKFSDPADLGGSYSEFLRNQFRAVAAAIGITYEQLTGDLTGVNYSSIRAGLLEFRRRCEMLQHGVIVHQLCRPVWQAWLEQAVLAGRIDCAWGYARAASQTPAYLTAKWIPQGWQWVDPQKEFNALKLAIRAGLTSPARKRSRRSATTPRTSTARSPPTTPGRMRWDWVRFRPAVRPGRCSRNRCRAKRAVRGCQRSDYERLRSR